MNMNRFFSLIVVLVLLPLSRVSSQTPPRIEVFSPQDTVKSIRQVAVRFSEQMVPFGSPKVETEVFDIDCPEKGSARWADERNWIFDFDRDLPAGVRCEFRLKSGLKTLDGREIGGQRRFAFSTGGPAIRESNPREGEQSIDEEQIFILQLDAEATDESVLTNLSFSVEGLVERIGVRIVSERQRQEILKARYSRTAPPKAAILLVQARQRFPAAAKVSLVWGKGIRSKSGVATDADQILAFKSRPAFSATFSCPRENPQSGCVPILPMSLGFSAPVARARALQAVLKGPAGKTWKAEIGERDNKEEFLERVLFKGPFPEKASFTVEIPKDVADDAGRRLINADKFPLTVRTEEYPPLAKFPARFGIIESKGDPALPVTLRNLEATVGAKMVQGNAESGVLKGQTFKITATKIDGVITWLRRVAQAKRESSVFDPKPARTTEFKIPKLHGAKAFEVVGIPLKEPGFYVVEIASDMLGAALIGKNSVMYVPTSALVTNLAVHFKWGRDSSLVWVTSLDQAKPVAGAQVQIASCSGQIIWTGASDANGIARVDKLPASSEAPQCGPVAYSHGLFVFAQLGDDMSFIHSSWDDGIEPWRFQLPHDYSSSAITAHTIFDRTLFRAGETVRMKHLIRNQVMDGFAPTAAAQRPTTAVIEHVGTYQQYEMPLQWDPNGSAESSWAIPKDAKLGSYRVRLTRGKTSYYERDLYTGEIRVEEFRVPLMKATIQPPSDPLVAPARFPVDLSVRYLAGGGAAYQAVKLRSRVEPKSVTAFDDYDGFVFANGEIKEGVNRNNLENDYFYGAFEFSGEAPGDSTEAPSSGAKAKIETVQVKLDKSGTARAVIAKLPEIKSPMEVLAELEFNDPSGQIQTVSSRIPLWPANRLVGIKPDSWALSKENLRFHVAVVDLTGKPAAGAAVKVELLERRTYAHRKRLVGGLYAYEQVEEVKKLGDVCSGKSDHRGLVICQSKSPVDGNVILQARLSDERGREVVANTDVWIAGKEQWWFAQGDHDRMDVLPEKKRYEPGEVARFQVRMPFKQATALVTVEREGIIDVFIKQIAGNEPVVEIPVRGNYAPNVFVSVLAVRGRVNEVQPTALVDLGRPAYKLGIGEINVKWQAHELKVSVMPERTVYKVRDKARVKIVALKSDGTKPPPGSEAAVAVVDEGLLELMPNKSWDLLPAMMGRRSYSVATSTAQMQVIGRRHFGLKAVAHGGGGGKMITRELFDTLLLWKGRVPLDANGEAIVEIPLNDSLTGFRIVAVVNGDVGLFGSGAATIRSTQELMLFSGIAPVVREGDRLKSEFTLRNATDRPMQIQARARVAGLDNTPRLASVKLGAGEAKDFGWDIQVPVGPSGLVYEVEANESGGAGDRIRVSQKVAVAVPTRTYQATIKQMEKSFVLGVERPKEALVGRGGVNISFRSKLAESLAGVTDYMSHYPYTCMEQLTSRAVALRDERLWRANMDALPSYLDAAGLVKFFPEMLEGSEVLTTYMLAIAQEAGWEIPAASRSRMETALRQFVEGKLIRRSALPTADLAIRKMAAIDALARWGQADPSLLNSLAIDANLWPTSGVIDWLNVLRRVKEAPNRVQKIKQAEQILRSRLNFQGTTMNFSTEKSDAFWWLMVTGDVNAVRLILALLPSESWQADMPRLAQGALLRQKRGAWNSTVANAWGVLAFEKFSQSFESAPVSGNSVAKLSGRSQSIDWNASAKGAALSFSWPASRDDVVLTHAGAGKPWVTVQSLAALPLKQPLSSGYKITKQLAPVERKQAGKWSKGDIVRVTLDLEAQTDMTWVVVDDPIPAGATILGSGLGRDSQLATSGETQKGWVWPAFQERTFEGYRAYYQYVPKGKWTVEYTMRLNQVGNFQLPTTRVEALYAMSFSVSCRKRALGSIHESLCQGIGDFTAETRRTRRKFM